MQRGDRDEPTVHGTEVGPLGSHEIGLTAADPVVLLAARIDFLDDGIAVAALALVRERKALDLVGGTFGHVYVQ